MTGVGEITFARLNEHTSCYEMQERLELPNRNRMPLAEVQLARCEDGWRFSVSLSFTTGNHWGSFGPIFARSVAYPSREDALKAAGEKLCAKMAGVTDDAMQAQRRAIEAWAGELVPSQASLFTEAGNARDAA